VVFYSYDAQSTESFFDAVYGEDISEGYRHVFVLNFTEIHDFIRENYSTESNRVQTTKINEFLSEISQLVISTERETNTVCLRYILIRPVAEGLGIFKMVLYYLAFLCKHYGCNLAVR
jgi:hypothetical protein